MPVLSSRSKADFLRELKEAASSFERSWHRLLLAIKHAKENGGLSSQEISNTIGYSESMTSKLLGIANNNIVMNRLETGKIPATIEPLYELVLVHKAMQEHNPRHGDEQFEKFLKSKINRSTELEEIRSKRSTLRKKRRDANRRDEQSKLDKSESPTDREKSEGRKAAPDLSSQYSVVLIQLARALRSDLVSRTPSDIHEKYQFGAIKRLDSNIACCVLAKAEDQFVVMKLFDAFGVAAVPVFMVIDAEKAGLNQIAEENVLFVATREGLKLKLEDSLDLSTCISMIEKSVLKGNCLLLADKTDMPQQRSRWKYMDLKQF